VKFGSSAAKSKTIGFALLFFILFIYFLFTCLSLSWLLARYTGKYHTDAQTDCLKTAGFSLSPLH